MIEDFDFSLSKRGRQAIERTMRVDLELWQEATEDAYHPMDNPAGKIALNVAENVLSWPKLQSKLHLLSQQLPPDWVSSYASTLGHLSFREIFADFFSKHLAKVDIDPKNIALSAGASSVIEMTSFLLADAGDVAAIPAPAYPVYDSDLGNFSQVERYDIITHFNLRSLNSGPPLTIKHLDDTRAIIEAHGKTMRMLILTSPDNPTGQIYTSQQLKDFADWCIRHEIHLVVNEIYGLSRIDVISPSLVEDYEDLPSYCSIAEIMIKKQSPFLHQWYAFSKDFGISGFRIGFLHTYNQALIKAYENYNLTRCVSNHTQWLLGELLQDNLFIENYIKYNQAEITASYILTIKALTKIGIPYAPARGSLFVWADFSKFLETQSAAGENKLWLGIYQNTGILLTPGLGFGHEGYGLLRIVFTAVPKEHLQEALLRLGNYLTSR